MTLQLKAVDAQNSAHGPLLDLFQRCREYVVHVAVTHLLPNCIAVTTKSGFIEVIDSESGEFHLYLTFLSNTPLDTALRCFALLPTFDEDVPFGAHLVYSLAYSNEVLLAELVGGTVRVLQTCRSRPSVTYCDADYIVCGEGNGTVTVWRAADEEAATAAGQPRQLWQLPLFEDAITTLTVHRGMLVCCAADLSCRIVDVCSGALQVKLPHEPGAVFDVLPLVEPLVHHTVLSLCSASCLSVYADGGRRHPAPAAGSDSWAATERIRLDVEIKCATCYGGYLAAGTASGVVLLYTCNAVTGAIEELVRFDVGYGVVGIQLYANRTLLVVTSAGDVWRWPIAELLKSADAEDAAADESEEVQPSSSVPQPHAEGVEESLPCDRSATQAGGSSAASSVASDTNGDGGDTAAAAADADGSLTASASRTDDGRTAADGSAEEAINASATSGGGTMGDSAEECPPTRATILDSISPSDAAELAALQHGIAVATAKMRELEADLERERDAGEADENQIDRSPAANRPTTNDGDEEEASDQHDDHAPQILQVVEEGAVVCAATSRADEAVSKAVAEVNKTLGPMANIVGLRKGRRMDPRELLQALQAEVDLANNNSEDTPLPPVTAEPQSTALLADQIAAMEEAVYDHESYVEAHKLEADALPYKYAIKAPSYALHDRVFEDTTKLIGGVSGGGVGGGNNKENALLAGPSIAMVDGSSSVTDDLMDVTKARFTRRKDPVLEAERSRGGPDISVHPCHDLIYRALNPSATVLFREYQMKPSAPHWLMLPMPLPPTPSIV